MAMDELVRALAAQRQGAAQVPGLELQLERANALRDEGYDFRNQTGASGIGAALSGIGTMMNNAAGKRQAASIQPRLAAAREQVAGGEEAKLLHNARRQAEQDRLQAEHQAHGRGIADENLLLSKARQAETERNNRFNRSQKLEKVDETLRGPDDSRVPVRHTNNGPVNAVTGQRITPEEWALLREIPKAAKYTGGRTMTVKDFKKYVESPMKQFSTLKSSLDSAVDNPQVLRTLSQVPTKFMADLAKATTQSEVADFIDSITGTDLATSALGTEEIKDSLLWWARLKKDYLAPELHELFESQVPKQEMQRFDEMMMLNDYQDPEVTMDRLRDLSNGAHVAAAGSINDSLNGLITNPNRVNVVRSWFQPNGKYDGLLTFDDQGNAVIPERLDIVQERIDRRAGEEPLPPEAQAQAVVQQTQQLVADFPQYADRIQAELAKAAEAGEPVTAEVLAEYRRLIEQAVSQ